MLEVVSRKKEQLHCVSQDNNMFKAASELLQLRIMPISEDIVRITFRNDENFREDQELGILDQEITSQMSCDENDNEFTLSTETLHIVVEKESGRIICKDHTDNILFEESKLRPHQLESFEYFKTLPSDNEEIEYIDTPDGKKPLVKNLQKVFDRILYHGKMSFTPADDEKIYGLGQHTEGEFNLRNTTRYLHQANMKVAMPLMISSKGYGILFNSSSPMIFEDNRQGASMFIEAISEYDFYFIKGTPTEIIKGYRQLTGKVSMLPMWAYGFVQSQERYETAEEMKHVVRTYREKNIGIDCIVLDWMSWAPGGWGQKNFDLERFPNPKGFMKDLHDMDSKFMVSVWPNMRDCDNEREFVEHGYMLPNCTNYNVFSKEAREMFGRQLVEGLYSNDVDAFWNDSTEPSTYEWGKELEPSGGKLYEWYVDKVQAHMPLDLSNAYSLYHSKAVYESLREYNDSKRVVNLTRSGYTGQQRFGTIVWSGDISANWRTLERQITEGLSFVSSGHPWWTLDIGAFFVKSGKQWHWDGDFEMGNEDLGYRELFARWYAYGSFLPVFRSHGTDTRRELWLFGKEGEPFYDVLVKYNHLRYQLMPTMYSVAGNAWLKDDSFMTPLYFSFGVDEKVANIGDQFMVGNDLMVCPVYKPMYYGPNSVELHGVDKTREIYFPAGYDWIDLETNQVYAGGTTQMVDADIMKLPVYVRSGGILLMGEGNRHAAEWLDHDVTVQVYDGADGKFSWYLDAGDGYGYENGEYTVVDFTYDNVTKQLTISDMEGSYPNMANTRTLQIKFVSEGNVTEVKSISYNGKEMIVQL